MISEPKKIDGNLAVDDRGIVRFVNDFNFEGVKRMYQVENFSPFLRCWHAHVNEGKYVYVARGTIIFAYAKVFSRPVHKTDYPEMILDHGIEFYLDDPVKVILSSNKPSVFYVPPGYANGFKTLTDDTIVQFYSTSTLEESKNDDIRFSWNYFEDKGYKGFWEVENR